MTQVVKQGCPLAGLVGGNGGHGWNWYQYARSNPLRWVDPSGPRPVEDAGPVQDPIEDETDNPTDVPSDYGYELNEYTIDYARFFDEEFEVVYSADNADEPITVAYDDLMLILGEDLDFGSEVPFGAEFTVPEESTLEIAKDGETFVLEGSGTVSLPEAIDAYNRVVSTEEFETAIRRGMAREKIIGGAQVVGGLAFSFVSLAAAAPAFVAAQAEPSPFAEMAIATGAIEGLRAGGIFAVAGAVSRQGDE